MAPPQSRQLLIWSVPTLAVLLSYFWYRRKRTSSCCPPPVETDPGDTPKTPVSPPPATPIRTFSRSLSGVDSAPIDIVIPPKLKAVRSNPVVISDEDLDLEIEKIKSMRYGNSLKAPEPKKPDSPPMAQEEKPKKERDSANHSPALSLSSISDNHSEGSNDSGKGGSEVVTPPPSRSLANVSSVYEFIIPQNLVGKLIGKHGSGVANIKDKTGAHVVVKKHPTNNKLKVCLVEGNQDEIDSALKLIRDKFPLKRFPEVTLEQVTFLPEISMLPLVPDNLYLKLIEGINNDTIVSWIVAPNHLFLQQPTHPSFPNLNILNSCMNACYSQADSPLLPTPVPDNTVCVALSGDVWYRAIVLSSDQQTETCHVKFLDYGGYAVLENSYLRQIRGDFLLLPFQAAECILANVKPIHETGWSEEAFATVAQMTKNAIIYTQIVEYTEEGIPLVYCYLILAANHVVFLNRELVNLGHAEWMSEGDEASGVTLT